MFLFHRAPRDPNIHQCLICYRFHSLRFCKAFLNMSVKSRRIIVQRKLYCRNCLARSHDTPICSSRESCQRCGRKHHTLLHVSLHDRVQTSNRPPTNGQIATFHQRISTAYQPNRSKPKKRMQRNVVARIPREQNITNHNNANDTNRGIIHAAMKLLGCLKKSL